MAAVKGTRKMGGTAPKPTPKAKNVNTTVKPFEQTAAGKTAWSKLNRFEKMAVQLSDENSARKAGRTFKSSNGFSDLATFTSKAQDYMKQRRVADAMYKRRQAATSAPAAAKAVKGAKVNNYGGRPSSSARKRSRGD